MVLGHHCPQLVLMTTGEFSQEDGNTEKGEQVLRVPGGLGAARLEAPGASVSSSCRNRRPQTRELQQEKFSLSLFWRLEV